MPLNKYISYVCFLMFESLSLARTAELHTVIRLQLSSKQRGETSDHHVLEEEHVSTGGFRTQLGSLVAVNVVSQASLGDRLHWVGKIVNLLQDRHPPRAPGCRGWTGYMEQMWAWGKGN